MVGVTATEGGKAPVPGIVAVAYDRPDALGRLLGSLARARYPEGWEVPLVISIDEGGDPAVAETAQDFPWLHGKKEVLPRPFRLGLREHVLACGDLAERFGAVILLEDDLFVSPNFYAYAQTALARYGDDPRIAGVSLYTHHRNVYVQRPFEPLQDGSDVFFLQLASSWGQAWTAAQWAAFRAWYGAGRSVGPDAPVPPYVRSWPESSWLSRFILYMVETDRQFVYPRVSLTTNFGDPGAHFDQPTSDYQVPLLSGARDFRFADLDTSGAVYDPFFEVTPACLTRLTKCLAKSLAGYDFAVDLYGSKPPEFLKAPYVLTGRPCRAPLLTFGAALLPPPLNVVEELPGSAIALCRREDVTGEGGVPGPPGYTDFTRDYPVARALRFALCKAITVLARRLGGGRV
jgi:hypothetical protein